MQGDHDLHKQKGNRQVYIKIHKRKTTAKNKKEMVQIRIEKK